MLNPQAGDERFSFCCFILIQKSAIIEYIGNNKEFGDANLFGQPMIIPFKIYFGQLKYFPKCSK